MRLPAAPSPELQAIAQRYFDGRDLLRRECFPHFEKVLEDLRRVDDRAVVYSDVLEFITIPLPEAATIERLKALVNGLFPARPHT